MAHMKFSKRMVLLLFFLILTLGTAVNSFGQNLGIPGFEKKDTAAAKQQKQQANKGA